MLRLNRLHGPSQCYILRCTNSEDSIVQSHQFEDSFLSFRVIFGTKHAFTHRSLTPRHCVLAIARLTFRKQRKILHRLTKKISEKVAKILVEKIGEVGKFSQNRKIENFKKSKNFPTSPIFFDQNVCDFFTDFFKTSLDWNQDSEKLDEKSRERNAVAWDLKEWGSVLKRFWYEITKIPDI